MPTNLVLPDVSIKLLDDVYEKIKEIYIDFKHTIDDGLQDYLRTELKYSYYIKTILSGRDQVVFDDIFIEPRLSKKKDIYSAQKFIEKIEKDKVSVIIGSAGSGKSSFINYLFMNELKNFRGYIPIILKFRQIKEKTTIFDYLTEKISYNLKNTKKRHVESFLSDGKFLFLFDGFDEVNSNNYGDMIDEVEEFVKKFNKNIFVFTSRPHTNLEFLPILTTYQIENFNKDEINQFLEKNVYDIEKKRKP